MTESRTTDRLIAIQTGLLGIAVVILMASVPFAYSIHGRLSAVEINSARAVEDVKAIGGDLKVMNVNASRIDGLERRIDRLEARMPP